MEGIAGVQRKNKMVIPNRDMAQKEVEQGLDFILTHFKSPDFPRTISTYSTKNAQIRMLDKRLILENFKAASYLDCRINAYPDYTSFKGINRTAPSFFMCDLDLKDFNMDLKSLDKVLYTSVTKIRREIDGHPTILWTGGGYHIYQPLDGFILDECDIFAEFRDPEIDLTSKFMRFAEIHFTGGKSDTKHSPSVKSCLVRVPNTTNSKFKRILGRVRVIQEWDGIKPKINWILRDFRRYLIQERLDKKIHDAKTKRYRIKRARDKQDCWIEKLLEIPIEDYRKNAVNMILAPYLINIKRLTIKDAFAVINTWLDKCSSLRQLDSNITYIVNYALKRSQSTGHKPLRLENLKIRNRILFNQLTAD